MTVRITSVEVYGHQGDPADQTGNPNQKKVKRSRRTATNFQAQARFTPNLRAASARVEGENFNEIRHVRNLILRDADAGHKVALIDYEIASNTLMYVYFVAWKDGSDDAKEADGKGMTIETGDLTISIDTVDEPASEAEGADDSVGYET